MLVEEDKLSEGLDLAKEAEAHAMGAKLEESLAAVDLAGDEEEGAKLEENIEIEFEESTLTNSQKPELWLKGWNQTWQQIKVIWE